MDDMDLTGVTHNIVFWVFSANMGYSEIASANSYNIYFHRGRSKISMHA